MLIQGRNSVHGTFDAPPLPFFLNDSPMPNGFPWGNRTDRGNNAYNDFPNTGMIRSYDFTITREIKAPDGYERDVLLVNGAFPGPTIEANWGDKIVVTVHNQITNPEEGTSLHWHGFLQTETPWQDGVPGITQCPIAPGKSHTYEFIASLYGSSWYHAHYSAQYADGIQGPIVIHGPSEHEDVIDVGPVMLSGESKPTHPSHDSCGYAFRAVKPQPFAAGPKLLLQAQQEGCPQLSQLDESRRRDLWAS